MAVSNNVRASSGRLSQEIYPDIGDELKPNVIRTLAYSLDGWSTGCDIYLPWQVYLSVLVEFVWSSAVRCLAYLSSSLSIVSTI